VRVCVCVRRPEPNPGADTLGELMTLLYAKYQAAAAQKVWVCAFDEGGGGGVHACACEVMCVKFQANVHNFGVSTYGVCACACACV